MSNKSNDIIIAAALRTPIGTFKGSLKELSADKLGTAVIKEVIYIENVRNHIGEYRTSINLEDYSSGIYLLEIQTISEIVSKKLILQ